MPPKKNMPLIQGLFYAFLFMGFACTLSVLQYLLLQLHPPAQDVRRKTAAMTAQNVFFMSIN